MARIFSLQKKKPILLRLGCTAGLSQLGSCGDYREAALVSDASVRGPPLFRGLWVSAI